jgi:hypothetical protein
MKILLVTTTAVALALASSGAAATQTSNARTLPLRASPTYEGWEIAGIVRSGVDFTRAQSSHGPLRALVPDGGTS